MVRDLTMTKTWSSSSLLHVSGGDSDKTIKAGSKLSIIYCLLCQLVLFRLAQAAYPPTYVNVNNCLYAYMNDQGHYHVTFPDADPQSGSLSQVQWDAKGSSCMQKDKPGSLIVNFELNDNNFNSMSIEFQFKNNWEISKVHLTIKPISFNLPNFPKTEMSLRPTNGEIYADMQHSYSCSELVLTNSGQPGPVIKITLKRFQVQPFPELADVIFAPSRDCSTWLTMPQIMGFIFILFMIFTVLIGVYLLLELGNHTSDLRFSKQGGMLMNQAQLDATKAD